VYTHIGRLPQTVCKFHYSRITSVCCNVLVTETCLNKTCILHNAAVRLCWFMCLCCANQRSVGVLLVYWSCFRVVSRWK